MNKLNDQISKLDIEDFEKNKIREVIERMGYDLSEPIRAGQVLRTKSNLDIVYLVVNKTGWYNLNIGSKYCLVSLGKSGKLHGHHDDILKLGNFIKIADNLEEYFKKGI